MTDDDFDLPEPSGAPHPIVAYTHNLEDRVVELEDWLIHMWEFMPADSRCDECKRIKDQTYRLIVQHARRLDGRG